MGSFLECDCVMEWENLFVLTCCHSNFKGVFPTLLDRVVSETPEKQKNKKNVKK